jgi:serine/threonine-protein kinase
MCVFILVPYNLLGRNTVGSVPQTFENAGIPEVAPLYFFAITAMVTTNAIVLITLSTILMWRTHNNRTAMLFAFFLLGMSTLGYNSSGAPIPLLTHQIRPILLNIGLLGILYLFPNGHFVHPRLIFLFVPTIVLVVASFIIIGKVDGIVSWVLTTALLVGVFSFFIRYRRADQEQRQQLKWLVAPFALFLISALLWSLSFSLPASFQDYYIIFITLSSFPILLSISFSIGFAILRYRLYEVDLVINRTLVYGVLGSLVVALFSLVTFGVQIVVGQTQPLIALLITIPLAFFAFRPTQRFIQHQIDRRIYRLRYDLNQVANAQKKPDIKNEGLYTGKFFGQYEALGVLGRGGMGEVYKGYHEGETVAIKILPNDLAQKDDLWKRFEREAETLQKLQHPHIVKWRESGVSNGIAYLVMEFVDGEELGDVIKNGRLTDYTSLIEWLNDIAEALDFAHEKGFVHRDIKPSNIMLRKGKDVELKEAILMDFGVARTVQTHSRITGTGAVGTIDYMAPEQILSAKEVDKQADIYALGVIVYELLTSERPFKGGAGQILFAHLQQPPPDARSVHADIPRHIAHAIEKAMAKNPDERYQSASEFVRAVASKSE